MRKTSEGAADEAEQTEAGLQEEKSKSGFGKNREEDAKKAGGTVRRTEADGTSDSWCALLLGTER